ncbi:MAG TPA: radical SAM protein [Moorella mulderi]|nr:radical SAM protein [Moorella mulderi]
MALGSSRLKERLLEIGVKWLLHDPERNFPKMLKIAEKLAKEPHHKEMVLAVKRVLSDENSPWYVYARRLLTQTHPNIRERMALNFFVNATFQGVPRQKEWESRLGVGIPWAILMDPTERCNLRCQGCWAGDYQGTHDLEFELMDRILTEAEELGIYFIVLSGGEPTIRWKDIVKLAERHSQQVFHLFTNGTLIDQNFVDDMVRLGNITVALSLEGFEERTDARRGKGVFAKVMKAMDLMRQAGVIYGVSITYNRLNTEEVGSDAFVDMLIDRGVAFGWYFTYIPIGKDVDLKMMATPQQRAWMYERMQYFRKTKPIFLVDFWNDGQHSNGCIAGGRRYFHITAAGEVEPCAFVHYSCCNIKDMSLIEVLKNPLFRAYQKRQPFHCNPLRPCPLIDNPEKMVEMVLESGAYSTNVHGGEGPEEFAAKLVPYARDWGKVADSLWNGRDLEERKRLEAGA